MPAGLLSKLFHFINVGKTRSLNINYHDIDDDQEALDEAPQAIPRDRTPRKDVYNCFVFMMYFFDLPPVRGNVEKHERFNLVGYTDFLDQENDEMMERARQADVLLLSSGAGVFDMDGFLKAIDISKKAVIVVSGLPPSSYEGWITSRIDFHFTKYDMVNLDGFNEHMAEVLKDLDGT